MSLQFNEIKITVPESLETLKLLRLIANLPYGEQLYFYVPIGEGQAYKDRLHVGMSRIKRKLKNVKLPEGKNVRQFRLKSEIAPNHSDKGDLMCFYTIQTERNKDFETMDKLFVSIIDSDSTETGNE